MDKGQRLRLRRAEAGRLQGERRTAARLEVRRGTKRYSGELRRKSLHFGGKLGENRREVREAGLVPARAKTESEKKVETSELRAWNGGTEVKSGPGPKRPKQRWAGQTSQSGGLCRSVFIATIPFRFMHAVRVLRSCADHVRFCLGGDERTSERRRSFQNRKPGTARVVHV